MEAAISTAQILGAAAPNVQAAIQLAPLVLVPQVLYLGVFIQVDQLPAIVRWAQW